MSAVQHFTPEQEARIRVIVASTILSALDHHNEAQREALGSALGQALDSFGVDELLRETPDV